MKRCMTSIALLFALILLIPGIAGAQENITYETTKFDVYGVQFKHPNNWKSEVKAEICIFTHATNPAVQLIFMEDPGEFTGTIDDYLKLYNDELVDKKTEKVLSQKPIDISGLAGYYIRVRTNTKDLGHVIFTRNKRLYVLALKTGKDTYNSYEPVLLEAIRSFKFVRTR